MYEAIDHRDCKVKGDEYPAPKPEGKFPPALTQIEPRKECHQDTHHGENQDVLKMLTHNAWTLHQLQMKPAKPAPGTASEAIKIPLFAPFLGQKSDFCAYFKGRIGEVALDYFFLLGLSGGFSCTRSRNLPAIPLARKIADSPYLSRSRSEAVRARVHFSRLSSSSKPICSGAFPKWEV